VKNWKFEELEVDGRDLYTFGIGPKTLTFSPLNMGRVHDIQRPFPASRPGPQHATQY
jgi:hypothetical protein